MTETEPEEPDYDPTPEELADLQEYLEELEARDPEIRAAKEALDQVCADIVARPQVQVWIMGLPGVPCDIENVWLVDYDPSRPGVSPTGVPLAAHLEVSNDREKAKVFSGIAEAVAYLRTGSGRTRPDGRPDRPVTAFTLEVVDTDREPLGTLTEIRP